MRDHADRLRQAGLSESQQSTVLAWFFIVVWGSGYLASKLGLQYVPPFTLLSMRFAFGLAVLAPLTVIWQRSDPLQWPSGIRAWMHVAIAGLLMHAVNLGGSHYGQYLGLSAGVVALILALQPLMTAATLACSGGERLSVAQWSGVAAGFFGVLLVVWHKIDLRAASASAVIAVSVGLFGVTAGTLYQRRFCSTVDLRVASVVQFGAAFLALAPLALFFEAGTPMRFGWPLLGAIVFLVIGASILAVNALHILMRRGAATRVTSLLYLTPIVAVVLEWLLFAVVPTTLTLLGMTITCAAVMSVLGKSSKTEREPLARQTRS